MLRNERKGHDYWHCCEYLHRGEDGLETASARSICKLGKIFQLHGQCVLNVEGQSILLAFETFKYHPVGAYSTILNVTVEGASNFTKRHTFYLPFL